MTIHRLVNLAGVAIEPAERDLLAHPLVGGVILFTRNYESPEQLARLTAEIHALRSPALLVAVDHEGGRVQRFREGFTRLPPLRAIGRRHAARPEAGISLARELGWLMAAELRACGVDLSFAPCVDLVYGVSEVIGDRAFHARAERVAELAVAYMIGMRDAGMAAAAKHFPGHGAVAADSHVALPVDRRELANLEPDLMPYRRMIANGLLSVMAAHVVFPAVYDLAAGVGPPSRKRPCRLRWSCCGDSLQAPLREVLVSNETLTPKSYRNRRLRSPDSYPPKQPPAMIELMRPWTSALGMNSARTWSRLRVESWLTQKLNRPCRRYLRSCPAPN